MVVVVVFVVKKILQYYTTQHCSSDAGSFQNSFFQHEYFPLIAGKRLSRLTFLMWCFREAVARNGGTHHLKHEVIWV